MPGISLIANFDVNVPFPIDSRLVVNDTTERDNIVWKYEGLKVYVLSERQSYIWQDLTWRVEYNGIYGGSGSLPGNVTVDFGTFSNNIGSQSYYFQYEVDSQNSYSYLQNQFIRHTAGVSGQNDAWQGIEFRQQLKYNNGGGLKESSYVSFNPKSVLGGISFGTGDSLTNTVSERMVITGDGRVGISTNSPQSVLQIGSYSTTNELPLVFDIRTARGSSIGYNWHYTTTDNFFLGSKGSSRISFDTNGLTFFNRSAGSPISSITHSLHISSNTNTINNVGIRTTDPRGHLQIGEFTSTTRPIVIHNDSLSSGIGYNWFYNAQDNVFDLTKSSLNIAFEQNGLNLKTRRSNLAINSFTSSLYVSVRNRVGINNSTPQYTLDVNGVINGSSDIQAGNDVTAVRDIKAGDKVETTNGYYFKPDPSIYIEAGLGVFSIWKGNTEYFKFFGDFNYLGASTIANDVMLVLYNSDQSNGRLPAGIVFANSTVTNINSARPGIFQFQDDFATNKHGISIVSSSGTTTLESLRISEGGKRIQIGVPSNAASGTYTFNSSTTVNSQIDTRDDFFNYNTSYLGTALTREKDLLRSGAYSHTTSALFEVYQYWIRVGRVVQCHFYIVKQPSGILRLSDVFPSAVSFISDAFGTFVAGDDANSFSGGIRKSTSSQLMFWDIRYNAQWGNTAVKYIMGSYTAEIA